MTINIIGSDNIKKYVFVKQQGYKDCACACLLMIIKYYNGFVSLEYLREITNTTNDGTTLYNLVDAAKKIGFNAYGLKGMFENLDDTLLPVIAHGIVEKKYKHFVVIYKIDKKSKTVTIADPAEKIKTISFEQFKKFSTGYYCILEVLKPLPKLNEKNIFSHFILSCIKSKKKVFIIGFLFSFFFIFSSLCICYYVQFIIDYAITYQSLYNLIFLSTIFLLLMVLKSLFNFFKNKICIYLSTILDEIFTTTTFNHILSLPYFYYKNHPSGEILTRIKDIKEISDVISKNIIELMIHSTIIILSFFLLLHLDQIFIILILFLCILALFFFNIFNIFIYSLNHELHKKAGMVNHLFIESLGLMPTLKNLGITNLFKNRFYMYYKKFLIQKAIFLNHHNQKNLITDIFYSLSLVLFIFFASFLIIQKKYSLGFLLTYQQIFMYFNDSFLSVLNNLLELKNSKIPYLRLKELYNIKEEENESHFVRKIEGNIEIKDLNFALGKKKILNHIHLKIAKGQKVMLFGPSGSGKSTLVKMLLKLIEVKRNQIFIDNIDVCDYDICSLRENICYLSQNEILLSDTIYNNVTLFRNVGYEEFLKMSKVSLLEQMINEKKIGYDTLLEENGFNLSGGERQKILITRTILKKASIYIFDESLSEIDSGSEEKILKKLFHIYKDKTIIVISHRRENMHLFDVKIKLENGVCSYER